MKTLAEDIKTGKFKSAYLICGEEEYLKLNYKNQLIKAITGDDTMNLGVYEGKNFDVNEVIDTAETFPFFAERRLIVMDGTGLFKSGGEELAEYMSRIPESTVFLFVEHDVDRWTTCVTASTLSVRKPPRQVSCLMKTSILYPSRKTERPTTWRMKQEKDS